MRDATVADAGAIAEIHVAGWRAAYRGLMPDDVIESLSLDQRRGFWKGMLSKPGAGRVAVGEYDGAIVGFCSYGPTRDEDGDGAAEIYALYVHPGKWRQGWGRALCEHAAREAAEREHRAMTLWVIDGNEPARRFYERVGYTTDGAERIDTRLIGTPFTEIRYRKAIG
ncbi:MAG TPA: GNAT family N-acetyltransferase [Burkholderiales bacterium]